MKRIVSALSLLAVANMLGIAGLTGWLIATKRLDAARIEGVRQLLSEPIPVELARLEEERLAAEAAAAAAEPPLPDTPPVPSAIAVSYGDQIARAAEFRIERQQQESDSLALTIEQQARNLEQARQDLARERAAFDAMRKRIEEAEGNVQFNKAVGVLKNVSPKAARAMLQAIIEGGAVPDGLKLSGMERAIAYLNQLPPLAQSEIMAQFAKDAPELAGELLERLRTHGLVAEAPGAESP